MCNLGLQGFKTHLMVSEYSFDMSQTLQIFCVIDLRQPFGGLSRVSRACKHVTSELCFPISESCYVWPSLKFKLVGFSPFGIESLRWIRLPGGSPVMVSCKVRNSSPYAYVRAKGCSLFLAQGFHGVKHRVSAGVENTKVFSKLLFPMQLSRFLDCGMKLICLNFVLQTNPGQEFHLLSLHSRCSSCA